MSSTTAVKGSERSQWADNSGIASILINQCHWNSSCFTVSSQLWEYCQFHKNKPLPHTLYYWHGATESHNFHNKIEHWPFSPTHAHPSAIIRNFLLTFYSLFFHYRYLFLHLLKPRYQTLELNSSAAMKIYTFSLFCKHMLLIAEIIFREWPCLPSAFLNDLPFLKGIKRVIPSSPVGDQRKNLKTERGSNREQVIC